MTVTCEGGNVPDSSLDDDGDFIGGDHNGDHLDLRYDERNKRPDEDEHHEVEAE